MRSVHVYTYGDINSPVRLVTGRYEKCLYLGRHQITGETGNWTTGEVLKLREI